MQVYVCGMKPRALVMYVEMISKYHRRHISQQLYRLRFIEIFLQESYNCLVLMFTASRDTKADFLALPIIGKSNFKRSHIKFSFLSRSNLTACCDQLCMKIFSLMRSESQVLIFRPFLLVDILSRRALCCVSLTS